MSTSKVGREIHRRLVANEPADYIGLRVGRKPRTIRWHRAGNCLCPERGMPPSPVEEVEGLPVGEPWAGITEATRMTRAEIEALITPEIQAEADRRMADVLERVREESPTRWLAYEQNRRATEAEDALTTAIPPDRVASFVADMIGHQRALLTVGDFGAWAEWHLELVEHRHPAMKEIVRRPSSPNVRG